MKHNQEFGCPFQKILGSHAFVKRHFDIVEFITMGTYTYLWIHKLGCSLGYIQTFTAGRISPTILLILREAILIARRMFLAVAPTPIFIEE